LACHGGDDTKLGAIWLWGFLKSGLSITAAHLTAVDTEMSVRIAAVVLPATVLNQASFEDVDLGLLLVDEEKLPANIRRLRMQLSKRPPWPGDPVIVDAGRAARSHIVSPQVVSSRTYGETQNSRLGHDFWLVRMVWFVFLRAKAL
jgi:hypothetical protein